jgi:uncharacterized protein YfaS (alpha-2-macroglobulin family)
VQLVQGRVEGQVVLVVTDLKVQVKQTDREVLVRVAGKDLAPRPGAQVLLRAPGGATESGRTDAKGEVRLAAKEPRLVVLVRDGKDAAVVDTDFYSTLATSPDVLVYTDRPIYRPGDSVQFRGLAREPDGFLARLLAPRSREVSISLAVGAGRTLETRARIDEFGSFHGKLAIPEDAGTGVVRLSARIDGAPHDAEARVQDYVKPTFYVEVEPEGETVRPGEKLRARIRARRYAGGAPDKTRYEVFLYRTLLESPAWVDDAGLGAQGSAVTYGSVSTTEGRLSVPERLWSSLDARGGAAWDDPWASAPAFDANGDAEVELAVPALAPGDERFPWRYTLSVRARDDQGTFANAGRSLFLAPSELVPLVRPQSPVALAGGEAPVAVRATTLSGRPVPGAKGTVKFVLRRADGVEKALGETAVETGPDGVWRGKAPAPEAGTVLVRATLADARGRPAEAEGSVLVVGKGGEEAVRVPALALASDGRPVAPDDEAVLVALLPAGWGPAGKDRGNLWVTLSGAGIFESRLVPAKGLSHVLRFPVERRFGSAVYASVAHPTATGRWEERTVPFRIVPAERLLTVTVAPERPEAEPLGPQSLALRVTDHRGRGVRASVSVGVVDKAIYALQGELRPRALDFFYPLGRDNVATFTSAEFQGYGYGQPLARLFGKKGHAFAQVKPPTRTREVDTALWEPSVLTDEDGRATVAFSLPANQTLWTVTALAADASGRFGEGTAEFAARGGTLLVASVPQFLREGDRAEGSVRLARGEKGAAARVQLALVAGGALAPARRDETVELPARGERIVKLALEAARAGPGRLTLQATSAERPLSDRRDLAVRPAAVEETIAATRWGGGRLALAVPAGATVEDVELSLRPSALALVLAQLEELLTYPHGCLEQLVATTIPNVALYRTLETLGAVESLDPPSRALLAEARSRAVQGTERILDLARPDGGFVWFPGESAASLPLTLIALDGLAHAVDAGLASRDDPHIAGSARWLEEREGLPLPLDAARAFVLARLSGPRQAARARALVERAAAEPADLYAAALAALAADRAGVAGEPAMKARIAALVSRSREAFVTPAALRADPAAFFAYPLRRAGLTAVLGHAASLGEVDLATARRRLGEALAEGELSTFERSTAILHSLWLVAREARSVRALDPPSLSVEGGGPARLAPAGAGLRARLGPATRAVSVGAFDGQAVLRARVSVPLEKVEARADGMSVERRYWKLGPTGRTPLAAGEPVSQGEEVYVELVVDADAHDEERWRSQRSAYWVLEDAVPAGFTPLVEDKVWRGEPHLLPLAHEALKRRSLSAERALFFFEEPAPWSRSPRRIGYVLRALFPGRFAAPPATVEDMYAPRVRGRSAPAVLSVSPSAASR